MSGINRKKCCCGQTPQPGLKVYQCSDGEFSGKYIFSATPSPETQYYRVRRGAGLPDLCYYILADDPVVPEAVPPGEWFNYDSTAYDCDHCDYPDDPCGCDDAVFAPSVFRASFSGILVPSGCCGEFDMDTQDAGLAAKLNATYDLLRVGVCQWEKIIPLGGSTLFTETTNEIDEPQTCAGATIAPLAFNLVIRLGLFEFTSPGDTLEVIVQRTFSFAGRTFTPFRSQTAYKCAAPSFHTNSVVFAGNCTWNAEEGPVGASDGAGGGTAVLTPLP